jgi:hypothetical protein
VRPESDALLVGNALAVMVAALELARQGARVALVNPARNWGGHFSAVSLGDARYDAGMVLYEFTSFSPPGVEDPLTYDPAVRNDAGRFCQTVRDYVGRYEQLRDIGTPQMAVAGALHDDVLIANALHALARLPFAETAGRELVPLASSAGPLHASRKREFGPLDYRTASLANHGATLHAALMEPFCRKVLAAGSEKILGLYHRAAWLPLFYPETLLSFLQGKPQPLPPTVFSYPVAGRVGDLAKKLADEIEGSSQIEVIRESFSALREEPAGRWTMEFAGREPVRAARLAWGNSLAEVLRMAPAGDAPASYEKCSITLAFLRVPAKSMRHDFAVLSIVEPSLHTYRITNQTACAGAPGEHFHMVAELNPDYAPIATPTATADIGRRIAGELAHLGLVSAPDEVECVAVKEMRNTLTLPTEANRDAFRREAAAARAALSGASFVGPASGFFSSSLNDQIVQGLQLARAWDNGR